MPLDPFTVAYQPDYSGTYATFGDCLLSPHGKWVWVYCREHECGHRAAIAYASFAVRWGMDATTQMIRRTSGAAVAAISAH